MQAVEYRPGDVKVFHADVEEVPGHVCHMAAHFVDDQLGRKVFFFVVWVRFGDTVRFYECSELYCGPETIERAIDRMGQDLKDRNIIPKPT